MRFNLLGTVCVTDGTTTLTLRRAQARAVLGFLLLNAGRLIPPDALVDAIWGSRPPRTARNQVQAAISAIRTQLRCLGDATVLTSDVSGYALRPPAGRLDLRVFEDSVELGRRLSRAGDPAAASATLRTGLALWRGPALGGTAGNYVESARAHLTALRISALEDLVEQELSLGEHRAVVAEFAPLLDLFPLRERLCGQLMRALHLCGRQADALDLYRMLGRRLADEYGLDPGSELRGVQQAILRGELAPQAA